MMAEDPDDDAQEGLEIGMVPSPDGSPQRLSVTFGADDPIIINDENENIDVDNMMAGGQKSTTTTGGISSTHSGTSGQSSYADSRLSGLSSSMPVTNTRKASFIDRKAKWPRSLSEVHRQDHMNKLVAQRRQSMLQLFPEDESSAAIEEEEEGQVVERKETMEDHSDFVKHLKGFLAKQGGLQSMPLPSMEVRLQNVSYRVPSLDDGSGKNKIPTIYNTSPLYSIQRFIKWLRANKEDRPSNQHLVTDVLTNVNLVLKPKCMYLVLGPPLSGKTSLLKAIAGMLQQDTFPKGYNEDKYLTGKILYNNLVVSGDDVDISSPHNSGVSQISISPNVTRRRCPPDTPRICSLPTNVSCTCDNPKPSSVNPTLPSFRVPLRFLRTLSSLQLPLNRNVSATVNRGA